MRFRWGSWSPGLGELCLSALAVLPTVRGAIEIDPLDPNSVKVAAQQAAYEMMSIYGGNRSDKPWYVPGLFDEPYFWWEAGAAFNALIDYWYYTGDEGYVPVTLQAMIHQIGDKPTYMPQNQSKSLGNDDQGFWGIAAMTAAEKKFPNPPEDKPSWLTLAMGVFNSQTLRWETKYCGGGLRWQIFSLNNGFDYKNTISNGVFFQLAARLARYTKNDTYAEWAEKTYDWTRAIGLESEDFKFFDGADINPNPAKNNLGNCTKINHIQWTYNAGMYLAGAAYMYNYTETDYWKERVDGILKAIDVFFRKGDGDGPKDVMVELACEPYGKCNTDQRSFKAYLSRFMAMTVKMAPHTAPIIMPKLAESARWAAKTCTGGPRGNMCSLRWEIGVHEAHETGLGQSMAALEIFQSNLIDTVPDFATVKNGISEGDPEAGMGGDEIISLDLSPTTTGDKVGAGFLTTFVLLTFLGGAWWMVI